MQPENPTTLYGHKFLVVDSNDVANRLSCPATHVTLYEWMDPDKPFLIVGFYEDRQMFTGLTVDRSLYPAMRQDIKSHLVEVEQPWKARSPFKHTSFARFMYTSGDSRPVNSRAKVISFQDTIENLTSIRDQLKTDLAGQNLLRAKLNVMLLDEFPTPPKKLKVPMEFD